MRTTTVFKSGNSQAVRLPKDLQFSDREVEIIKRGDELVLRPVPKNLSQAYDLLATLPEDFMAEGRDDSPPQERAPL